MNAVIKWLTGGNFAKPTSAAAVAAAPRTKKGYANPRQERIAQYAFKKYDKAMRDLAK